MALRKAHISCELREVILRDKPNEMLRISAKGTVPVLQLSDGQVMEESLDIMLWALEQHDPDAWLDEDKEKSRELISKSDFDFKEKLDRYKYFERFPEYSQQHYRQEAEGFLVELEGLLKATNGRALIKEKVSLVDVALFPFVRQFARVDWEWFCQSGYTLLKNWLCEFEQGELFQSVMKKYPQWHKTNPLTLFA